MGKSNILLAYLHYMYLTEEKVLRGMLPEHTW